MVLGARLAALVFSHEAELHGVEEQNVKASVALDRQYVHVVLLRRLRLRLHDRRTNDVADAEGLGAAQRASMDIVRR